MSMMNALRGIGGEFEIQRILGAIGTLTYIVTGPALVWAGKVDVTFDTFCISYTAGLAACLTSTAGAVALKDRQVTKAQVDKAAVTPEPAP